MKLVYLLKLITAPTEAEMLSKSLVFAFESGNESIQFLMFLIDTEIDSAGMLEHNCS